MFKVYVGICSYCQQQQACYFNRNGYVLIDSHDAYGTICEGVDSTPETYWLAGKKQRGHKWWTDDLNLTGKRS